MNERLELRMNKAFEFLHDLRARGCGVRLVNGKVGVQAKPALSPRERASLKALLPHVHAVLNAELHVQQVLSLWEFFGTNFLTNGELRTALALEKTLLSQGHPPADADRLAVFVVLDQRPKATREEPATLTTEPVRAA